MKYILKIMAIFCILIGNTFAEIEIQTIQKINSDLEKSHHEYYSRIVKYTQKSQDDTRFYFKSYERVQIIEHTKLLLASFDGLNKLMGKKRITQINSRNLDVIALKTIKYKWLAKFVNLTFLGGNGFVAVLSEDLENLQYEGEGYRSIIKELIKESRRSNDNRARPDKAPPVREAQFKNMVYLYDNIEKLQSLKLSKDYREIVFEAISQYVLQMDEVLEKIKEINYKSGSYSVFYFIKVSILKALSYIALPGGHKISLETLKKVDKLMLPGDIGIIQRYNKLSNIVFKGNWTHSLLYLGEYSKFKNYFDSDLETNSFYALKCFEKGLNCTDYLSFLDIVFNKEMTTYRQGEKLKDPIVTIESLKPGVILQNMKKSMGWDNLAILRPKLLTRLDKARAIEKAFESLGKPYDYNFNGHTQERFVCTELVSYAYESDPSTNKGGLSWEMNFVMNKPVMYAFDILETYFKRQKSADQELSIVYYLKGEKGEFGKSRFGSEAELLDTVDLAD